MSATAIRPSGSIPEELRSQLEKLVSELPSYAQEFSYLIGWASDHDKLFRGEFGHVDKIDSLLTTALSTGRVFLYGRGGGGKTAIFQRLAKEFVKSGYVPVLLNLKSWTKQDYERWSELGASHTRMLNHLIRRFAQPPVPLVALDFLDPRVQKLFLVDGLNEVRAEVADEIVSVFDGLARDLLGAGVIISDRIVRRTLRSLDRWRLASVLPLTDEEIDQQLRTIDLSINDVDEPTKSLLGLPFFLDEMLTSRHLVPTSSAAIGEYFDKHVSLSGAQMTRAATAAFAMYGETKTRTFPLEDFAKIAGSDVVEKLKEANALVIESGTARFDHHLKHDYLVARYLAESRKWRPAEFKTASFNSSSFDTLAMVPEQLEKSAADEFVTRLYDWNLYGTAYVIAEGYQRHAARVSDEMETVILAMLAEKRWDIFEATSQKAEDSLNLFPTAVALRFRKAENLEAVFDIVRGMNSANATFARRNNVADDKFARWRDIFTTPATEGIGQAELDKLVGDDSVEGWTIANVLKRRKLAPNQQAWLRDSYRKTDQPVRWRIVHVLGAFPTIDNGGFLLNVVAKDSDASVRYGAIRSAVEVAARSSDVRPAVFAELSINAATLVRDPPVLDEMRRCLYLRQPPTDWVLNASKVIIAVYREVPDARSAETWLQTLYDLESRSREQS